MDCTCPRGSKQATLACTRRRQCAWSRSELSAWSGSAPEFQAKNGPNSCLIAWFQNTKIKAATAPCRSPSSRRSANGRMGASPTRGSAMLQPGSGPRRAAARVEVSWPKGLRRSHTHTHTRPAAHQSPIIFEKPSLQIMSLFHVSE